MRTVVRCVFAVALVATAQTASAGDLRWDEGQWRLELSGFYGLHQGRRDRSGEPNVNVTIDYEAPLWKRNTLSLRLQPLFYYDQDDDKGKDFWDRGYFKERWYDEDIQENDIFGVAIGPVFRIYANAEERRGLFGEFAFTALIHSDEFDGNSSQFNFISSVGVGYKFQNDWHVTAIWRHISNAGIGSANSGVNGVGLGIGYSF